MAWGLAAHQTTEGPCAEQTATEALASGCASASHHYQRKSAQGIVAAPSAGAASAACPSLALLLCDEGAQQPRRPACEDTCGITWQGRVRTASLRARETPAPATKTDRVSWFNIGVPSYSAHRKVPKHYRLLVTLDNLS